ncbi:MAG TPA: glycoside hydrolase family 3 C-terminal domain-containing protein [Pyrinomonadaceae bacterium]|nr:glycoside hydrolase family 3 C-terminal domain-containing protein [Pyrinomonadaceae bacterium]
MRRLLSTLVVLTLLAAPARAQQPSPEADARVEAMLKRMTLEEKIDLLGGTDGFFVRAVERVGLPRLKMADGPAGVRNFGPATTMPSGIALAAAWNTQLAERVGTEIARDARAKGVHFLLGPGVNIYRAPMNGRNFEYFGEDPFLAARTAVGYIRGVQSQGVAATIKHYAGNNSEFNRHNTDSVIDERTLREIYLPAFEAAVREARVAAIMNSYNLLNGEHASQNKHLLTDIAKQEWGFDGVMMSDWFATYDGVAAANAGQDLEMPGPQHMNRKNLLPAVEQGRVSAATIDDKVRRILRTAARFGWLDRDQTDLSVPRFNQQGRRVALEAAREGVVLLKNEGGVLPLDRARLKSVAVIGPSSYPAVPMGGGSGRVEPFVAVSIMEGLSNALASSANVYHHRGLPTHAEMAEATNFVTEAGGGSAGLKAEYFDNPELKGAPVVTRTEPRVNFRRGGMSFPEKTISERFTGYYVPKEAGDFDVFVESTGEDGGSFRLYVDDRVVLDNWSQHPALLNYATLKLDARPHKVVLEHRGRSFWLGGRLGLGFARRGSLVDPQAKALAARSDVVVVAAGFDHETESEAADRTFRLPPGQDELIREMAAANKNTVVVLTSGGNVDMAGWVERVPALVEAWYPGQEGGTALAEVLLGDVNPSGRLPVTFERRWEDNPAHASYYPEAGTNRVVYKEGVFVGYRGYEKAGVRPLFPFGHGLSYTTFAYSNLSVRPAGGGAAGPAYEVSFDVKNTGTRAGADVAQVYVGGGPAKVPRPIKELKGFAKVHLRPGETKRVTVALDGRAFSYYDAEGRRWRADPGDFEVLVGRSSAHTELRGKLSLTAAEAAAIK